MDKTLTRGTGRNRRRRLRNHGAWRRFSTDGKTCPYCPHDGSLHLVQSAQPHFYRKATADEEHNPHTRLYRYTPPGCDSVLVRRMTVARNAEIVTAYCHRLRRGHENQPGPLLPAQHGGGRGGGLADEQPQEQRKRRLKAVERKGNHDS